MVFSVSCVPVCYASIVIARSCIKRSPLYSSRMDMNIAPACHNLLTDFLISLDLYTAGTVVLAVLLIPSLQDAVPDSIGSIEASLTQCIESLSMYEKSESTFAKKCLRVLQTFHSQKAVYVNLQMRTNGKPAKPARMEFSLTRL